MQGNSVSRRISKSALIGSTAILMGMAISGVANAQASSPTAPAQPGAAAQPGASVGEVVVTGSRIARRDFTSNSPIVTVNSQAFQNTANVAVESTLNKLPQFTPDQNMTGNANAGDVQPTGTHTVGISTVSLRGFGPNRNLVLADGQRMTPSNGELVVDVNSIPAALIDHVEVITGGASAVYGADAVAGVVNFILKKNYQGLDVDAQYGVTQVGDGNEFKISTVFGTNFADDKGNVTFALEHYTRAPSWQRNRDFYKKGFSDPTVGNNEFFFTGAAYSPDFGNSPSQAVVNTIFSGRAPGSVVPAFGVPFYFNNNSTVFTGGAGLFGGGGAAGAYRYTGPIDGVNVAHVSVYDSYSPGSPLSSALKTNQTNYYVTAPLNRYSLFGDAHYDITDNLTAYVRGNFTSTHTHTILFPTPFITGWGVDVPADAAHPVPTELATLLNSRPNAAAPWQLYLIPSPNSWLPPRSTDDDNNVWQMTAGLKGKLPISDFTWEMYGSHGQASDYNVGLGYASLKRYEALIQAPNYGANATLTGNLVPPNFGFGAASVHCTTGFYSAIFQNGTPSQDCINAITAQLQSRTLLEQNVVEFDTQGSLFKLPAGEVKISLGADFRDDSDQFTPDVLQSTVSFTDQVAGVYPTAYMNAATSAREGYGELLIPVVDGVPFMQHLEIDLGARYSTYTAENRLTGLKITPAGGWTYKIEGDWKINDWARIRGGYNLAVRSPNVGELFLGQQEVYAAGAATTYGDPCSLNATAPFGANPAKNPNATSALNICKALMGGPASVGSNTYYASVQAPGMPSPFGFVEQEGNPNLKPEKAHTWTAGLVLSSPWHGPLVNRIRASVDWYSIKVNGAIEFNSVDNIKQACLSQSAPDAATAATVAASPACQLLSRNPGTGAEAPTTIVYSNLATIRTSGFDFQLDWAAALADMGMGGAPGTIAINAVANYLNYFDTQSQPGAPFQHWAGTLGPSLTGTNFGMYKFKTNTTFSYSVGPASVSLNWRWLPHVHSLNYNPACVVGCYLDTKSNHQFDLSATYTFMQNYVLRAGVQNIFDTQPPTTGNTTSIPGFSVGSSGYGTTNEGLYDALGRRFYVGLNAKF